MSARDQILELKQRINASVIGQEAVVDLLLIALLADGHLLMEGLPGLAKTRTIKTLAKNLEAEFRRIQFTPDLLPSDITGSEIYTGEGAGWAFHFQPGPHKIPSNKRELTHSRRHRWTGSSCTFSLAIRRTRMKQKSSG
jgi:MoxR-like ATPase